MRKPDDPPDNIYSLASRRELSALERTLQSADITLDPTSASVWLQLAESQLRAIRSDLQVLSSDLGEVGSDVAALSTQRIAKPLLTFLAGCFVGGVGALTVAAFFGEELRRLLRL